VWKICAFIFALVAVPAFGSAGYTKIDNKSEFLKLVQGKTLTRPLVKLNVSSAGNISGRGATWDIEGRWRWENGYFCRNLVWGGEELGYNCQEVGLSDGKIRFTSDQGTGNSAEFRLR
jgi:hypothetical protein